MISVEDRLDVTDVLHHYATCIDTREPGRLTEVFAAETDVNLGYGRWRSADEVCAAIGAMIGTIAASCHTVSNVRVAATGDGALATSYVTAWHWNTAESGPADFVLVGNYRDHLRRTADGWRIVRRRAGAFGPSAVAAGVVPDIFQLKGSA